MRWQEACAASSVNVAVRVGRSDRVMLRFVDGSASERISDRPDGMSWRAVTTRDCEGWLDWEPLEFPSPKSMLDKLQASVEPVLDTLKEAQKVFA